MSMRIVLLLILAASFGLSACGGDDTLEDTAGRLPHVLAPVDTLHDEGIVYDEEKGATGLATADARWTATPPRPWLPRPLALRYSTYRNEAFRFSIAYPDSVMKQRADIGGNHGREFASFDSTAIALVYAIEQAGAGMLDRQFQEYIDVPGIRLTYRVREPMWYAVSGYKDGRKFYEKAMLDQTVLKTFHIEYDTTHVLYYDAITASMAASFKDF